MTKEILRAVAPSAAAAAAAANLFCVVLPRLCLFLHQTRQTDTTHFQFYLFVLFRSSPLDVTDVGWPLGGGTLDRDVQGLRTECGCKNYKRKEKWFCLQYGCARDTNSR